MSYKLFIDDEREPIGTDWLIARSSKEAIQIVVSLGMMKFISFDHDLGGDDTSMRFVNWFIDYILDNGIDITDFDYFVHSANPIGAANIRGKIDSLKAFQDRERQNSHK